MVCRDAPAGVPADIAATLDKALTEIADFNAHFDTAFPDQDHDTVGGLVLARFGRMPKRGESVTIEGLRFTVLRADSRRLHLLQVQKLPGKH